MYISSADVSDKNHCTKIIHISPFLKCLPSFITVNDCTEAQEKCENQSSETPQNEGFSAYTFDKFQF